MIKKELGTFSKPVKDQQEKGRVIFRNHELLRPVDKMFPNGNYGFLAWGKSWGYHINKNGMPVKGRVKGEGQHLGVDIMCPVGTPVKAPANMTIIRVGEQKSYGLRVIAKFHRQRKGMDGEKKAFLMTFGHLSSCTAMPGDFIPRGKYFAFSGNTGNSTAPHLHCQLEEEYHTYPRPVGKIKWVNS